MSRAGGKDRGLQEFVYVEYTEKGKAYRKRTPSRAAAEKLQLELEARDVKGIKLTGEWWVVWLVGNRTFREKAGTKSQAQKLQSKRQAEKLTARILPETVPPTPEELEAERVPTVAEMIEHYRTKFEAKASGSDDARYARYWIESFGTRPADQLSPGDIEGWRDKRLAAPPTLGGPARLETTKSKVKKRRAPGTVNRPLAFLKRIYNLAIKNSDDFPGLADLRNPAAQVEMLEENNERCRWLSEAEEERLRAAMEPEPFRMVEISFLTGMRMGEQFGLRRHFVDLRNAVLTIPKSKHGKKRHVHLGPRGLELFKQILQEHESEWVFPSPQDPSRPRSASGFRNVFLRGLAKAKIRDFHFHDLRHTYGSRLAMAGVDLIKIRDLMGHKTIAMTERYSHLCPEGLKKAVAGL